MSADSFLSRWSRRKAAVQGGEVPVDEAPEVPNAALPVAPAAASELPVAALPDADVAMPQQQQPLTLDDVAQLTPESDYARFVAPSVDADVRNAAMKKLFTDPHYNIMDGLDTYIEDYGIADPIPEAMLRQMVQSKALGLFDHEEQEPEPPLARAIENSPPQDEAAPVPDIPPEAELTTVVTPPTIAP